MLLASFLVCVCFGAAGIARGSWNEFGTFTATDFFNEHRGLVSTGTALESVTDSVFTSVLTLPISQIAIQDADGAWAVGGDTLYYGTQSWSSWRVTFVDSTFTGAPMTLVRATSSKLFLFSNRTLYWTIPGDTILSPANGIIYGDSIRAIDDVSDTLLFAVSSQYIYRSRDGGKHWIFVYDSMMGCASVFVDSAHHCIFTGGDNVRVSSDSGATWHTIIAPGEFGFTNLAGQVYGARDCSGTFYLSFGPKFGTSMDMMRSTDDGTTFEDAGAIPGTFGASTTSAWVFDRGSTVFWNVTSFEDFTTTYATYNGADGLIPNSIASDISVTADTVFDTLCSNAPVFLTVTVSSSICTGVEIDSISERHSNGLRNAVSIAQVLNGTSATFQLPYSGTVPGVDTVLLQVRMHSVAWGVPEIVPSTTVVYSVEFPPLLRAPDSVAFGPVLVGQSKRLAIHIVDSGCATLRIDSMVSSNPLLFSLPKLSFPLFLQRDVPTDYLVTYTPRAAQESLESIELGTNAGHIFIELDGSGYAIVDRVGRSDIAPPARMIVVPNPASNVVTITGESGTIPFSIIDALGRVAQTGFTSDNGTIDVSRIPNGMYLLRCSEAFAQMIIDRP